MYVLAILEYLAPLETVVLHTDEHRAYLRSLHATGNLLASGPFVPRTGGAFLLYAADAAELAGLIANDPFSIRGIARYVTHEWAVTIGLDLLEKGRERPIA